MYGQMSEQDVVRIVGQIDATRRDLFSMDHVDKPQSKAFPARTRQDKRITRAKTRARTAAWRKRNAVLKRATSQELSMAVLRALATANPGELSRADLSIVGRAFADLQRRGFDIGEAKESLRRIRESVVAMEADENSGI